MEPRCWVTVQWITLSKPSLYKEDPKAMATTGDKIPWDTCVIALIFGAFKMEFLKSKLSVLKCIAPPPPKYNVETLEK